MKKFYLLIIFLLLDCSPLLAENPCIECAKRKLQMCGEECALVPTTRVKDCQKSCITQYCSHKCTQENTTKDLDMLFNIPCEECKDQQYGLCSTNCQKSSEYQSALCQIECAHNRCEKECVKK